LENHQSCRKRCGYKIHFYRCEVRQRRLQLTENIITFLYNKIKLLLIAEQYHDNESSNESQ